MYSMGGFGTWITIFLLCLLSSITQRATARAEDLPALAAAYVLVMAVGGPLAARAADPHRRGAPAAA